MGDRQIVADYQIAGLQLPAAESLIKAVLGVASRDVCTIVIC
jgi:hypothetical protein